MTIILWFVGPVGLFLNALVGCPRLARTAYEQMEGRKGQGPVEAEAVVTIITNSVIQHFGSHQGSINSDLTIGISGHLLEPAR